MRSRVSRIIGILGLLSTLASSVGIALPAQATTLQVVSATLGPDGRSLSLTFNHPVEVAGNCCINNLVSIRSDGSLLSRGLTISGSNISGFVSLSGVPITPGAVVTLEILSTVSIRLQKVGDPTVYWSGSTVSVTNNSVRLAMTDETQLAISGQYDLSATHPTYSNYAGNTNFDYYSCVSNPVINSDDRRSAYVPYVNGSLDWIIAGASDPSGPGVTIGVANNCYHLNTQYSARLSNSAQFQSVLVGNQIFNPSVHGSYILAASRTYVSGATHYFLRFSEAQIYTPPTPPGNLNSMPSFSVSGSVVTFGSPASWSAGSNPQDYLVACTTLRTATTSPSVSSSQTAGCRPLYSDMGLSIRVTDLATAIINVSGTGRPYDPAVDGGYVSIISIASNLSPSLAVSTASHIYVDSASLSSPSVVEPTPYTGPILQAPGAVKPVASGAKVVLDGSNLTGVSKITIDGKDAKVKVNSDGELEITVPAGLAKGTYDLVVTSDSGELTVQDGIRVDGSAGATESTESTAKPSTRLKEDDTVKVYVFNVVGAGKVQIMHNGKEVAWINTDDPDDAKILNDYLVRTLELLNGKNIIEIFVNGKRVDRKAYTKVDID